MITNTSHSNTYAARNTNLTLFLVLVFATNVVNIGDRFIFSIVLEPLKAELGVSDTALGLLSGLAFSIFYTTLGFPLAMLADRGNRRNLVALSVGVWSACTALCGAAQGYWQLLLARIGVASGEAGFTPALNSMMADYFPKNKRARVMAIYGVGGSVGILIANILGGYITEHFGWRWAFAAIGLPGVLIAVLFSVFVREPARGISENLIDSAPAPSLLAVLRHVQKTRALLLLIAGATAWMFSSFGALNWLAVFYIRVHGLGIAEVGIWLGLIVGVFSGIGILLGGYLADYLSQRFDMRWQFYVPSISVLIGVPLALIVYLVPDTLTSLLFASALSIFTATWQGPTLAMIQTLAPLRMRATTAACLFFSTNLIGFGFGPSFIGFVSDLTAPQLAAESIRFALVWSTIGFAAAGVLYFLAARCVLSDESNPANPEAE
ncbi:spinster family MFS transporter [Hyphococcus sp.]|uniref:spinster family MFS transporter n=1 Tax=Hyphococcus sp. TaxID=2038636 RepID=UPI00208790F6|nr:MAG: MFS transporter [Marinicaulis sp.]